MKGVKIFVVLAILTTSVLSQSWLNCTGMANPSATSCQTADTNVSNVNTDHCCYVSVTNTTLNLTTNACVPVWAAQYATASTFGTWKASYLNGTYSANGWNSITVNCASSYVAASSFAAILLALFI